MAIEAPYSSFKLKNYMIYFVVCIAAGGWLAYDGYFNEKFIEKYTENYGTEEAVPDSTLVFNQKSPFILAALAAGFAVRRFMVKDFKIIVDDEKLVFGKRTVVLDSIEKIDKTHFAKKGHFTLFYKDATEGECQLKLSDRTYDNLNELLEHIVAKIS
jgi:hypothetical protein